MAPNVGGPSNHDKELVEFDVGARIRRVLDDERTLLDRAVRAFQFHVAILWCSGMVKGNDSLIILVPKRKLLEAKLFTLMRFVEHGIAAVTSLSSAELIETTFSDVIANEQGGQKRSAELILGFWAPMVKFIESGGWRISPPLPGALDFDSELKERAQNLALVGKMLDLSLRVDPSLLKKTQQPGVTRSIQVISHGGLLSGKVSEAKLKREWTRFKPVAVLGYLQHFQAYDRLTYLAHQDFAQFQLDLCRDEEFWSKLVANHEEARKKLQERGYSDLQPIPGSNVRKQPVPDLIFQPLADEVQAAMAKSYPNRPMKK
jgi:hypothetical protein